MLLTITLLYFFSFFSSLAEQSINAPPSQRVVADSDSELQCASEIPGTHTMHVMQSWKCCSLIGYSTSS